MDYEQKYIEALKVIESLYNVVRYQSSSDALLTSQTIEKAFPELKESEDEKSKKWILEYLYDGLRKSDEQFKGQFKAAIAWLEKQGEPKSIDNVEPKFKVGDWVVYNRDDYSMEILQIYDIRDNRYYFTDNIHFSWSVKECDEKCHLWTIKDVKNGDVLSFYSEHKSHKMVQVGMIEKYVGKHGGCSNTFKIYVGVNWENKLQIGEYMGCSDIRPATKEQHDLLFQKMREAGYVWIPKKLKKIESKPAWSEEDEKLYNSALWHIKNSCGNGGKNSGEFEVYNWLKSLKDRIQPQPKQEWSEEDDYVYNEILKRVADKKLYEHDLEYIYTWLKYPKPHWKPSDTQMSMLLAVLNDSNNISSESVQIALKSLYNDIKKL